jgi:hypothetical protein
MVFFEAEGIPDSASVGSGPPPFPHPTDRVYDLYVIGDAPVEDLTPPGSAWGQDGDLPTILSQALAMRVVEPGAFGDLQAARGRDAPRPLNPDSLAGVLVKECKLIQYKVPMAGNTFLAVQTCQRRSSRFGPYFVRVVGPGLTEPAWIRGELDFFVRVDGVPYMVLRDLLPGTGAWGYEVYGLYLDSPPERVHSDGSWST